MAAHNGKYIVELLISPNHGLYHASCALSGLAQLASERAITLRAKTAPALDPHPRALLHFRAQDPNGTNRSVVIDFADAADSFSIPAIEHSDIYFKRSFMAEHIIRLPTHLQPKVRSYGLNFAALDRRAIPLHLRIATHQLVQNLLSRRNHKPFSVLREYFQRLGLAYGIPPTTSFERRYPVEANNSNPKVLLQTRLWPPRTTTDDMTAVNTSRIALVRTLKTVLGDRFVGGILTDAFSLSNCPHTLLVGHKNMREYADTLKEVDIGIYVRGLHHSLAFKMAEYLAAGLCIVSEPITHELPVPLEDGINYLSFRDHDECVDKCAWLQTHPESARRMRNANIDYYKKWVAPRAHMMRTLESSFSSS